MTTNFIRVVDGAYRNFDVSGKVFQLVSPYKSFNGNPGGGFVVVKNNGMFVGPYPEDIRVKVPTIDSFKFISEEDYVASGATPIPTANDAEYQEVIAETDEEAIARIRNRFEVLDEMTKATTNGDIRAMIVSGPPGVGKSYGVETIIEKACLFDHVSGKKLRAEVIKGSATALGLYMALYKHSDDNCVLVFDDCDTILFDDVALNLLKGALDTGRQRKISWLSDSRVLKEEGIPNSFIFNGAVIFISNLKFDKVKSTRIKEHLDALQSRCHYLDLTLDTMRDKILRIKQIAQDSTLFADLHLDQCAQDEIIEFMTENKDQFREISLRMAIKVAQLRKSFPLKWKEMAQVTCMQRA
jgi:hypothetical protein